MAVLLATTIIAFLIAASTSYMFNQYAAGAPVIISYFIVPLVVFLLLTVLLNRIATPVNTESTKMSYFLRNKSLDIINSTSYMQIWPPIMVVLLCMVAVIGLGYNHTSATQSN